MPTPLVLMATDRTGWCFDHIAQAIQQNLSQFYRFKIMPFTTIAKETCDILIALCWERALHAFSNTKCKALVPCVYDHLSWGINDDSRAHFLLTLKNSAALGVCNRQIERAVRETFSGHVLPPIYLIEDGVDTTLFKHLPMPDKFACGWTGMSTRCTPGGPADYKGLTMLRQACIDANVEFRVLDGASGGVWPLRRMPVFYQDVSVQLIGSCYEGTPNPLLEAMSMGRPVISTDVGLAPDLIKDGENGYIIPRDPRCFTTTIREMARRTRADLAEMGQKARRAAERYSWKKKAAAWKSMLDFACIGTEGCRAHASVEIVEPAKDRPEATVHPPERGTPLPPMEPPAGKKRPPPEGKPHVLLISDVPDWAFHQNMKDLELHLSDQFKFKHWFVIDYQSKAYMPNLERFDIIFCVYHRWSVNSLLPMERTLGSLRAYWFFPELPGPVGQKEYDLVNGYRAFHVVTSQNYQQLVNHCPNMVYLTNPVNMDRFPEATPIKGEVIASWNGNAKHRSGAGDVKGFRTLIEPACRAAEVPLEYAEYNTNRLAPADMPGFYQKGNVALCASMYEGASNSVMEAMASGQALITTACGNVEEMQYKQQKDFGDTGIIIVKERSISALAEALRQLRDDPKRVEEMGQLNRQEIAKRWSWGIWAERYADFLRRALP
jgi:glycosyltransferase involved in cell wall biosynthesis